MKYNGREVIDISVGVELGKEKLATNLEEFINNEIYVANILKDNGIVSWSHTEAPVDSLVIIAPKSNDLKTVNNLFSETKKIFNNVNIQILYDDFDKNGHKLEELKDYLSTDLLES